MDVGIINYNGSDIDVRIQRYFGVCEYVFRKWDIKNWTENTDLRNSTEHMFLTKNAAGNSRRKTSIRHIGS